jgi:hypothetical protein
VGADTDERLLAVLWGSVHDAISGMATATWCLPTAGVLLLRRDAFLHHAEVEHSRPWQELGELSLSRRPGYNGGHDIETTLDGRKLHLQATSGTSAGEMTQLTTLLRATRAECISRLTCSSEMPVLAAG